jgi:hypothetical protein
MVADHVLMLLKQASAARSVLIQPLCLEGDYTFRTRAGAFLR